ncbi:MAG: glycoside hydrolase family 3 C-terminal domain-containing protein [bacterium]
MRIKIFLTTVILLSVVFVKSPAEITAQSPAQPMPFQDHTLSVEKRTADLLSRLTLDEKVMLLAHRNEDIPRLGVKRYIYGNEGLHGVMHGGKFTVFPQAIALSSTWNTDLMLEVATAISDEARAKHNQVIKGEIPDPGTGFLSFWSPDINITRDPRWGRTPETYGEDPYMEGSMCVAFVQGLQGSDPKYIKTVATPKHYVANNEEYNRFECNAIISERALREYYLAPFEMCVREADAQSIMAAYNAVNGIPCNADRRLLTDVLRGEWGFDGYVVTDCNALFEMIRAHRYVSTGKEAAAAALNAGIDLECGSDQILKNHVHAALKSGLMTEETLNQAVARILKVRFRLGLFDPPEMIPYSTIPPDVIASEKHRQLARRAAQESIVLLKNDKVNDKPLLPLDLKDIKSIAVVGPKASVCEFGDYSGEPAYEPITPLAGIRNKVGNQVKVNYVEWMPMLDSADFTVLTGEYLLPSEGKKGIYGLKAEYFNNNKLAGEPVATRIDPAINIDPLSAAPDTTIPYGKFSVRWTGKLVPDFSGGYRFAVTTKGRARLYLDGKLLAESEGKIIPTPKTGEAFNLDWMNRLRTEKLTANATLEAGKTYNIELDYIYVDGDALVRLEWAHPTPEKMKARKRELETISNSDAVIAVLGIGREQEREAIDRPDLDLPFDQEDYIRQVIAANPKTVVVLINGSPLSINWISGNVPAIIDAWYPGEQGGNAIADVLFGDYNPAGRLPFTFYKSVDDLLPFDDYEVSRGRTYMYFEKEPLYPFGYGLSYTTYEYTNIGVDKKTATESDTITVSMDVKNTGGRDGDEVVQLYVRVLESSVKQPLKRLKGYRRIHLKRGEAQTVSIPLAVKDLRFWDERNNRFVVEPGEFEILVGASAGDIRLREKIEVKKQL